MRNYSPSLPEGQWVETLVSYILTFKNGFRGGGGKKIPITPSLLKMESQVTLKSISKGAGGNFTRDVSMALMVLVSWVYIIESGSFPSFLNDS